MFRKIKTLVIPSSVPKGRVMFSVLWGQIIHLRGVFLCPTLRASGLFSKTQDQFQILVISFDRDHQVPGTNVSKSSTYFKVIMTFLLILTHYFILPSKDLLIPRGPKNTSICIIFKCASVIYPLSFSVIITLQTKAGF